MAVDFVQAFSWGPITSPGGPSVNFFRIPFAGAPHILGSAYLKNVYTMAPGQPPDGAGAWALFTRFEFLDDNGRIQETEILSPPGFVEVQRCVSITIMFLINDAHAVGGWSFYWLS
jgi:hypothetical protein